jgi:hypothetical protein
MKLTSGLHLAYCTNIHRGETWGETFESLERHALAVRDRVSPGKPYAIGLRLSDTASRELSEPATLDAFRAWLDRNNCYVFTINGFPYGKFHGGSVKENVYRPDWTGPDRLEYTNRLFDLLAALLPDGVEGSVSTLPGSFKEFITDESQITEIRRNLWSCVDHIERLTDRTGKTLHLGVEPEPLGLFETTPETCAFFDGFAAARRGDERWRRHFGVNYDTCHLAIEFEEPGEALARLQNAGIRVSKLHLSCAIKLVPTTESRERLRSFSEPVYLHQVVAREPGKPLRRYRDLDLALNSEPTTGSDQTEWRVHFHVPLHSPNNDMLGTTSDHLLGVLDLLAKRPELCSHLEMETYTWEVLPSALKTGVVDQLAAEYHWTLRELQRRGIQPANRQAVEKL